MMTLKPFIHDAAVQVVQTLLNSYLVPAPNLHEDGQVNPPTRDTIIRFQKIKRLRQNRLPRVFVLRLFEI